MADNTWTVLVALETLLDTITQFPSVTIGWEQDMFHQKKFQGNLPALFLEYHGDDEEGPLDSSDERYVPFTATIIIVQVADSVKQNRREKMQTATIYRDLVKNKIDSDPQLGGLQVAVAPLGQVKLSEPDERVPTPWWSLEMDVNLALWEAQSGR